MSNWLDRTIAMIISYRWRWRLSPPGRWGTCSSKGSETLKVTGRVNSYLYWFLNQILTTTPYSLSGCQWKPTLQLDSPPWPMSELWSRSLFPFIPPDWGHGASRNRHREHYTHLHPIRNHVLANGMSTLTFERNGHLWHSFSTTFFLHLTSPSLHTGLWSPTMTWPHQMKTVVYPTDIF